MKRLIVATPIAIVLVALFAVRAYADTSDLSSAHHIFLPQLTGT